MYDKMVRLLLENGVTLRWIGAQCGVDPAAVRRWKLGIATPTPSNAEKLQWLAAHLIADTPEAEAIRREGATKKGKVRRGPAPPSEFTAERIAALMAKHGWSNNDLAKLTGVGRQSVSLWRGGRSRPTAAAAGILRDLEANPPTRAEVDAIGHYHDAPGPGRLAALKEAFGWGDRELAEALGVHVTTARNWVLGHKPPTGAAVHAIRKLEAVAGLMQEERE